MKKIYFIILLFFPIILLAGCNNLNQTNTTNDNSNVANVEISRTGTISNDTSLNILLNNTTENTSTKNNTVSTPTSNNTTSDNGTNTAPTENLLYEFSTPLKSKSANRLNNIQITCSTLNGVIVKPKEEFSFCQTIGKATEDKGYKKADVIVNKEVTQALGGGNCQVSSTLYNAVLGIPDLTVTERHPHGKAVNYVPEGKDAAVSYGSKDLKFINNTANSIKIYSSVDNQNVYIKIVSIT
ncbi:MAG: VanW family protein [Clostridia bacterium]|nr:VanW family protein [Clostridia bacterium]